jgi:predicted nicotinamide N-methyase
MAEAAAAICGHADFVAANTRVQAPPLIPEIRLHLASEILPIWQMGEDLLAGRGLPPPYWAFAWAGGQALARHVLDHPEAVRGRRVLDFASGSGLVAIAAAMAGGAEVAAADIDPFALAAIHLNARVNRVDITTIDRDPVGRRLTGFDVVLAGDIFYEQPLAGRVCAWLCRLGQDGVGVLVGDPGRTYLPRDELVEIASYEVATTRELEDCALKRTGVWRFRS